MKLEGSRVVGVLLLWLAVGFLADAALAPVYHEATEPIRSEDVPAPGTLTRLAKAGIGVFAAVFGLVLALRDPGEGRVSETGPGPPTGDQPPPRRCWRCRASWPREAERCPECGAERLR